MPSRIGRTLQIATRQFADTMVVAPHGRIDHQSSAAFEAALRPLLAGMGTHPGGLVLDFAGVDYISSVGLRVVMIAAKDMKAHQAPLVMAALQDVVAEIFTISRFDRFITILPTLADALALCSTEALAQHRALGGSSAA